MLSELERLAERIRALEVPPSGSPDRERDEQLAVESRQLATDAMIDRLRTIDADAQLGWLARRVGAAAATSSVAEVARLVLESTCDVVAATRGYIVVFGADDNEAKVLAAHPPAAGQRRPSRALLNEVLQQRRSIRLTDAAASRFSKETSVMAMSIRSILATPLSVGDRPWGAVLLESDLPESRFEPSAQGLIEAIATFVTPLLTAGSHRDPVAGSQGSEPTASSIVGRSPAVVRLHAVIARLGVSDVPVLIEGESGSGKELVARALHFGGRRSAKPFVAINCAAIPDGLLESELFGHERGAFTGAGERKQGRFEAADGGTLFLDEIGEIRFDLQPKLLRVLQEQSFTRVGGAQTIQVDVRLAAASNRSLREMVADGRFREDLYHRLAVVPIEVPPLRERPEDIPLLARTFLAEAAARTGRLVELEPEVMALLGRYRFPGNVRELRNLIERLVVLAEGDRVLTSDLPSYVLEEPALAIDKDPFRRFLRVPPRDNSELKEAKLAMAELYERYVRRLEGDFVKALLEESGGSVSTAARKAGMNRTLFYRKLREAEQDGDE